MTDAGFPSLFGLGSEDGHVPTFWLLLHCSSKARIFSAYMAYMYPYSGDGQ